MSQPPSDQPSGRHPGYGPNPPQAAPQPHQGYGPLPTTSRTATRDPLGVAALVLGAVGPVLGFLFVFVQATVVTSLGSGGFAAASVTQSVLIGLASLAAVILGLVAISKPGGPKALASAGLALGAAGLLGVLGNIMYPLLVQLMYG